MKNGYKSEITAQIKDRINNWIDTLKGEKPERLLTKQWNVHWPKGFKEGNNVIPVVTGSKKGRRIIGEVQFLLPQDLELDLDSIELVLKNEPYKESRKKKDERRKPVPLDEPIDLLNDLVVGVNEFLQSLNLNLPTTQTRAPMPFFPANREQVSPNGSLFSVNELSTPVRAYQETQPGGPALPLSVDDENLVEKVSREMLKSPYLPGWFKTLESREVYQGLLKKLSEGFIHYQRKLGKPVDLKDFFEKYTQHLKETGKLHHYCKYKSKPVNLDESNWCLESHCSKKPYNSSCPQATLKFGQAD